MTDETNGAANLMSGISAVLAAVLAEIVPALFVSLVGEL